ncbi:MAG: adenosylcobinamide amidohydrolase, partial [Lacticaseibacillus rhamnosus]
MTEGKTAALQDLGIADVNNGLPATGTGADGITLITDPDA